MPKLDMTRRVYDLPTPTMDRVKRYMGRSKVRTEAEAIRRLLLAGLDLLDTPDDVVERLRDAVGAGRSLRDAAAEIVVGHRLTQSVHFEGGSLRFRLADGVERTFPEKADARR